MRKTSQYIVTAVLMLVLILSAGCREQESRNNDGNKLSDVSFRERLKKSLVYLDISTKLYDIMRPWRQPDVGSEYGFGCIVDDGYILTTAWNVADASLVRVRINGQNKYFTAKAKAVDYHSNLALLEFTEDVSRIELTPINFAERFPRGRELKSYWLSAQTEVQTGSGKLDRADVQNSSTSFVNVLNYIASGTSGSLARGKLFAVGEEPIGIACWADSTTQETGIIPAEKINPFLADVYDGSYDGFAVAGFNKQKLLDPALRRYLELPEHNDNGVYISQVYNLGTGAGELGEGDVLLSVNGYDINSYGNYEHPEYGPLSMDHIMSSQPVGTVGDFRVWRDGGEVSLDVEFKNFNAESMLVSYFEYDKRPEYVVVGGCIFQKLTREYLKLWGENWPGTVPPHLYYYYANESFNPDEQRRDIIILSYVLPARLNLGYHHLGRIVVDKFNGRKISRLGDILDAMDDNESDYHIVEFEQSNPKLVLDKESVEASNMEIAGRYGISELYNVR